jgi:hypothetical protein
MKKIITWVVVVVIAILGVYSYGQYSTPTVYPVFCEDWGHTPPTTQDFSSCHKPYAYARETFTVDVPKNQVIQTSPDTTEVNKLNYCTIQDETHWSCGDGSLLKMPGGILATTKISRSGNRFYEYGLINVIFVTESEWSSINNGAPGILKNNAPEETSKPLTNNTLDADIASRIGKKSDTEKCVVESNVKICDLKYSSEVATDAFGYRNVLLEGNSATCIDMDTGKEISNDASRIRAKTSSSFCVSDFGYVYIDPTIQVTKHWNEIKRKDYSSPYTVDKAYDTCIWTWEDGSGQIPYIGVYGNVGARTGYNVKAFCKNGINQVDIYTYKQD